MSLFLCKLWSYLAGGLIGWLLAGWFARKLKHAEPPIEKIVEKEVEKIVDNPEHLSLISKLKSENSKIPDLISKLSVFESGKPKVEIKEVEKVVEIESPALLARIKELETESTQITELKNKLNNLEKADSGIKEENSVLIARIKELEEKAAQVNEENTELQNKLQSLENKAANKPSNQDKSELVAKLKKLEAENAHLESLKDKIEALESAEAKEKIVEIDNPELLAKIKHLKAQLEVCESANSASDVQTGSNSSSNTESNNIQTLMGSTTGAGGQSTDASTYQKRIHELENELKRVKYGPKIDLDAARAAGISIKNETDLTAIEGIGPKISDLIKADGIQTFKALADTSPSIIQNTLDKAGPNYKIANPDTWPDQANLAANNRWPALKALQDVLVGGVYPSASTANNSTNQTKSQSGNVTQLMSNATSGSQTSSVKYDVARASGFKIKKSTNGYDDFTIIEGIGPKINGLIHDAGIHTYAELGKTLVEDIQKILDKAGPRYKLARPGTWPAQADMAADNNWEALKKWQDELDGGKE